MTVKELVKQLQLEILIGNGDVPIYVEGGNTYEISIELVKTLGGKAFIIR